MLSGKTWRKDCKDKERVRVENNCAPQEELLKGIKAPVKERDKRQKLPYTNVSSDPHRSYEQGCDERSAKGSEVGRALLIQRVTFLLQQHWVELQPSAVSIVLSAGVCEMLL